MKCAWTILALCGSFGATANLAAQQNPPVTDATSVRAPAPASPAPQTPKAEERDHPGERWQWFVEQRSDPNGRLAGHLRLKALRLMDSMVRTPAVRPRPSGAGIAAVIGQWTSIGPQPIQGNPVSSGRITSMAVAQQNANLVYVGAADGGVWKTTDGGATWVALTDAQPSMAIGALALDPQNPNIIYAGTGEADNCSDCYYGVGILKSIDGGVTWTNIQGPFVDAVGRGVKISSLAVSPQNSQIVLAAAAALMPAFQGGPSTIHGGIYLSKDAGATWALVADGGALPGTRVIFNPVNPSQAFATISGQVSSTYPLIAGLGVFVSNDAGATWSALNGTGANAISLANSGRIELALAPSNPQILFASVTNFNPSPGNLLGLYKSSDGGQNWTLLPNTPDYCSAQCWYNNVLAVDPTNPSIVYAGGIGLYRSIDGGQSWSEIGGAMHVDHHALGYTAGGAQLYDGNDGGMWVTNAPRASNLVWNNLNNTLSITQFYPSLSIHPGDLAFAVAGAQDNGTQLYNGSSWTSVTCGDGGWTVVDPAQSNTVYATCQYAFILKSTSGGTAWFSADSGISQSDTTAFIAPIVMDPSNSQRLYFGTYRLWRTTDGAASWSAVSGDLTQTALTPGPQSIRAIAVAPSDPQTVYTGSSGGQVYVTTAVDSGDPASWVNRSQGLPPRFVTQIQVDPAASATAYVAFSGFAGLIAGDTLGHVFRTKDGGATWLDISGNLPNIPVNDMALDPDLPGTIYLATDIGVFVTSNAGLTWQVLGAGLPRVVVMGLRLHRATRTLRAVTHGRGVWDILVPLTAGFSPAPGLRFLTPAAIPAGSGGLTLTLIGAGFLAASASGSGGTGTGTIALWNGQSRPTTVVNNYQMTMTLTAADVAAGGLAQVSAMNPAPGGGVSNALSFQIGGAPAVNSGGIVNAASFVAPAGLAPGSLASLFGTNFSAVGAGSSQIPLPTSLNGVSVNVNGTPSPLIYASPQQINFQIPWGIATPSQAVVTVNAGGSVSPLAALGLSTVAPGIFTTTQTLTGQGAILIANTATLAAPATVPNARPAAKGEAVSVFCTGLGAVTPAQVSGRPAPGGLTPTVLTTTATIGGQPAVVTYSGLAPGFVGLYQVNVTVPANAPSGNAIPLVLSIGGVASNAATLAIQ
jgi:uncharacterized protein (TIGR03437 family)